MEAEVIDITSHTDEENAVVTVQVIETAVQKALPSAKILSQRNV
jgi:hypothetical protein